MLNVMPYFSVILSMLKVLSTVLVLSACAPSDSYQKATHPALIELDKVKFISAIDVISSTGAGREYKISPNGKWISWIFYDNQKRITFAFQPRTGNSKPQGIYSDEPARFFWGKSDKHIFLGTTGRLFRFDADNLNQPHVDVTPRGFSHWNLAWRPQSGDGLWYIGSRDRNPAFSDIYTVKPDGSGRELLFKNPGKYIGWSISHFGKYFGRRSRLDDDKTLYEFTSEPSSTLNDIHWNNVFETGPNEKTKIISSPNKLGNMLALSNRGRNTTALVSLDSKTGAESVIAESADSDVVRVFMSDYQHWEPALVWYAAGHSTPSALNEWGERFLKLLKQKNRNTKFANIISHSKDHRYLIVEITAIFAGSHYHLFDMTKMTRRIIGNSPLSLNKIPLSSATQVTISGSDGLPLPSVLTLPSGVEALKIPMILLVHGGPAKFDAIKPDFFVQFLANRGYGVLQVNYRGSTGFGKKHQQAGFMQFGRKMQKDLIDSIKWAVDKGIADPNAVAIVGASFGGYASMMGLAQNGELFAAGVSISGVTDLHYQTNNTPFAWQLFGHEWKRYFGDPQNIEDSELMKQFSPVTLAEYIKKPVLLLHGKQDRVVGVEQAEKLEKILTKIGNKPVSRYFANEAHGFNRYESIREYLTELERFLAKHLGGRASLKSDE